MRKISRVGQLWKDSREKERERRDRGGGERIWGGGEERI